MDMAGIVKVASRNDVIVGLLWTTLPHERGRCEVFNAKSFGAKVGKGQDVLLEGFS